LDKKVNEKFFGPTKGLKQYGKELLSKFKWGHSFYEVNESLLDMYAKCKDGAEVVQKQIDFLKNEKEKVFNENGRKIKKINNYFCIQTFVF
jgi:hypothetical protein